MIAILKTAAVVSIVTLGGLGLVSCSMTRQQVTGESPTASPSPATRMTDERRRETYAESIAALPCEDKTEFRNELTFFDANSGADCYLPDGGYLFVRVYNVSTSVGQTLTDWQPTFDTDRQVVYGMNWYVVGPPK